ncbi:MAG: ATP-binding protein [Casimicrobiaceae bacterium]
MRLIPRSLFGRTLLVLAVGLVLVEIASQVMNFFDRGSGVYRLAAQQTALRIARAAQVLNRLPPRERPAIVGEMNGGNFSVALASAPLGLANGFAEHDRYERELSALIRHYLRADWSTSVAITSLGRDAHPRKYETVDATPFEQWMARHFYFLHPGAYSIVSQVTLEDGSLAVFYARMPQEPLSRLESLLPRLLLSLVIFMTLGAVAVATITRSLKQLARAADHVAVDLEGSPLPEVGPSEVRSVIRAFNRMRALLRGQVVEQTRMLAAISHDLRTPVTRMRLRAEMIEDPAVRVKFVRDLDEMRDMTAATLDFFKGVDSGAPRLPVDIGALVASLAEDWRETGADVTVQGAPLQPCIVHPRALRRCLDNLVDNGVRYGKRVRITIEDNATALVIAVRDEGPGIAESDLERVFEPFYRVEPSRNRDGGGIGLGLAIARNIARWHGGDIALRNATDGSGLIAELILPRSPIPDAPKRPEVSVTSAR